MIKKILVVLIFATMLTLPNVSVAFASEDEYVKVIFSYAYVFSDTSVNSDVLQSVSYGTKLKLLSNQIQKQQNGLDFYLVEISTEQNTQGYVLCSHVLNVKDSSLRVKLETNATTNKETVVCISSTNGIEPTENKLANGQAIRVLKKGETHTQIQYLDKDGDIVTAYLLNEDIKMNGVSGSIVSAILIIISTVTLVIVLFGVRKKKAKK